MNGNYQQLIEFISENSGVSVEDIERKIEAKQAKLSGLISKEGAAQVVAAELNINFEKQILKISQVVSGMRKVNLIGKVVEMFSVREYNKNGRSGRIATFILADDTSNIRTVLWDENHIDLIARNEITEGSFVEISNASIRNGELHLGSFSEIKLSDKIIHNLVTEKPVFKKEIIQFIPNERVAVRAFIVNMFEPRFFEVCPECRKKVSESKECNEHGRVVSEKRSLLSLILDDGTGSIRATIFSEDLEKIFSNEELENLDLFSIKKKEFLGKEMIVRGLVKRNSMFEGNDFVVSEFEEVDIDKLIEELES
ncbi:MAG: hypothetical protein AABX77_02795 [Nanoarchaeota archaeon]